ncbi:SSI family serine proteinase inhibitor [Glycomyces salinus]|uniref:SSI family serine proteinase inhibitor n=1 Tax=Glycomyces salinus TaxID=980294 RepID=UPI0018EDC5C9|nr:SSI family serine proteinase inhibitor [Glycomyces salinus]
MIKRVLRAGALLAAAALIALAAPAQSHPVAHDSGVFYLKVTDQDGLVADAVLTCPGGWLHPHGAESCSQLAATGGDISGIPPAGGFCHLMYRPVTVAAHGHWNGDFRSFEAEFGNLCRAVEATGGYLFDFG